MMKLIPTIQGMTQAPQMPQSIPFAQPQANPGYQAALASSSFDDGMKKGAGIYGNKSAGPNVFSGQGPANIVPDAQGNVGIPMPPQGMPMTQGGQPVAPVGALPMMDGGPDMSTSGVGKRPRLDGSTNPLFQTPGMDQISKMLMMGGPGPAVPNG